MSKTIEAESKIIPNRYTLTRVISLRVNQLLKGANPRLAANHQLVVGCYKNGLTYGGARQIAMAEILAKKAPYIHTSPARALLDENTVVFS